MSAQQVLHRQAAESPEQWVTAVELLQWMEWVDGDTPEAEVKRLAELLMDVFANGLVALEPQVPAGSGPAWRRARWPLVELLEATKAVPLKKG